MIDRTVERLAGILACPHCHAPLTLDSGRRTSTCPVHGTFPFAGPFPSFVSGQDAAFEDHWDRNATAALAPVKLGLADRFLEPVTRRFETSRPLAVLDAGCGEGAHIAALSRLRPGTDDLGVGLDIAATALPEAARTASPAWGFVHGDMMALPFPDATFDAVFSFGVLALTPQPRQALGEMARVLKPGGLLGFWVFPGTSALMRGGLRTLRGLSRALGPSGATAVANAIVPFYGLLPTRSGLSLRNADWLQTREVLMSNLTPPYLHFLDEATLRGWLGALGIAVLPDNDGERITLWGEKR